MTSYPAEVTKLLKAELYRGVNISAVDILLGKCDGLVPHQVGKDINSVGVTLLCASVFSREGR